MVNVPNILTALRLVLAPFIVMAILAGQNLLAIILFIVAAITDVLDGWAARRFWAMTKAGAYFDPVADKVLMDSVFLALAIVGTIPWWFVLLVVGRDLYILIAAGLIATFTSLRAFPPSRLGKWCTFVQIIAAALCMIPNIFLFPRLSILAVEVLWASGLLTIASGIQYTVLGIRRMYQNSKLRVS
jgi:cardiolipin synthase (CMP-forming)